MRSSRTACDRGPAWCVTDHSTVRSGGVRHDGRGSIERPSDTHPDVRIRRGVGGSRSPRIIGSPISRVQSRGREGRTPVIASKTFALTARARLTSILVVDNADRIKQFLVDHSGTFFCNRCLSVEAGVLNPVQVNQLTRPLRGLRPYRTGRVICSVCGEERACISYQ